MRARALLLSVVAVSVIAVVATAANGSGSRAHAAWPPQKYRYTGWLSPGSGDRPLHAAVQADTFALNFDDASSRGTTPYRVCWAHPSGENQRCAARVARSRRISRVGIGGPHFRLGRYVARWYVRDRLVASWAFLYSRESVSR